MAVIKESRQFKIGPVGVARASDTRQTSRALSEALSAVGKIQYDRAARNALKVGEEAGQSAIVIDPETGLPEPLVAPKGFGSIASDAYDRVARNRFEFSIQNEIQVKGQELAAKYMNNRNGSALYHQTMSDYIESMTEAADGAGYKSYIADTGTAYRDLTTQKLALAQQERERSELIASTALIQQKGLDSYEALIGVDPEAAEAIAKTIVQGTNDAVESQLFSKIENEKLTNELKIRKTRGVLRYLTPEIDPEDLFKIEAAFDNANPSLLPEEYKNLSGLITQFGNDFNSLEKVANFASEYIAPLKTLSAQRVASEREDVIRKQSETTYSLFTESGDYSDATANLMSESFNSNGSTNETASIVRFTIEKVDELKAIAKEAFLDTDDNPANAGLSEQARNAATKLQVSVVSAIISSNSETKTRFVPEEIDDIVKAFEKSTPFFTRDLKKRGLLRLINKLVESDPTGTTRKSVIEQLKIIKNAGDIEEAKNLTLSNSEANAVYTQARQQTNNVTFIDNLMSQIEEFKIEIKEDRENGLEQSATAGERKIAETLKEVLKGTIARSLKGLSVAQATQQLVAIAEQDPEKSPTDASKEAIETLLEIQKEYPKSDAGSVWLQIQSRTNSYKAGAAKQITANLKMEETKVANSARNSLGELNLQNTDFTSTEAFGEFATADFPNPETLTELNFNRRFNEIENIAGIKTADAIKGVDVLRAGAVKSLFKELQATDLNEEQIGKVLGFFNGNMSSEGLTQTQANLILKMKSYADSVLNKNLTKTLQSDISNALTKVQKSLAKKEANKEKQIQKQRVLTNANVMAPTDRNLMQEIHDEQGINLSSFSSMSEEQQKMALTLGESTSPSSFFDKMDRIIQGLPVEGAEDLMNYYSIMSSGISPTSTGGVDWLGGVISEEDNAMLKDAIYISRTLPNTAGGIQQVIGDIIKSRTDTAGQGNLKNVLGEESAYDFALNLTVGFGNSGDPLIATEITELVKYLGYTGKTKKMITKRIDAVLDENYPKTDFIINSNRPLGDIKRSKYSLKKTIKNPEIRDIFTSTVNTEVSELSKQLQKIDSTFPDLRLTKFTILDERTDERKAKTRRALQLSNRRNLSQTLGGSKEGNVYLEPDDSGALFYKVYYADENNELIPLIYSTDKNGIPVEMGTEGSIDKWASYSIDKTVGHLIRDDLLSSEIDIKIQFRKNAKLREQEILADKALTEGVSGMENFARKQELTKRSQLYAPSEIVGNQ